MPAAESAFLRGDNFRGRFWMPTALAAGIASEGEPLTFHELRHTLSRSWSTRAPIPCRSCGAWGRYRAAEGKPRWLATGNPYPALFRSQPACLRSKRTLCESSL